VNLALDAEFKGAIGVVVNAPTPNETIRAMKETIDIPIVVTVVSENTDFQARIDAGTSIFNVSGASKTVDIIKKIRDLFPQMPIIATGGPNEQTIMATIEAGANAVTYTPPTPAELFRVIMDKYRADL
jgi:2-keto-3-deoxy-6-phosphogluconate aldolase